jgi:hypothetical protein
MSGRKKHAMKILRKITFGALAWGALGGALAGGSLLGGAGTAQAGDAAAHDNLDATLWTQTSVEFEANAFGMIKLAEVMLDRALADKS